MKTLLVKRAKKRISEVDAVELHSSMDEHTILVDVREPEEFSEGHIEGAVNMPRGVIEVQIRSHPEIASADSDPGMPIYLYCVSGARSALAAASLMDMGYGQVYSLAGGIVAWRGQGYPVIEPT